MRCLFILFSVIFFQVSNGQTRVYDNDVKEISDYFNSILKLSIRVDITNGKQNESLSGNRIILSRVRLSQLYQLYDADSFKYCLSFIIGHEFGHQLQFKNHSAKLMNTASCEVRTLLETQADVYGGYLFYRYNASLNDFNSQDTVLIDRLNIVMRFVYNLGIYENAIGLHPGFKQRRNAFRHGIIFGLSEFETSQKHRTYYDNLIERKNMEGVFLWSFEISKKIVHYPLQVLNKLAIKKTTHNFQDSILKKKGIVSYSQDIKNTGDKPISLFIQYKVVGIDTTKFNDPTAIPIQAGSENKRILIQPGKTATLSGQLDWKKASNHTSRPVIKLPPDNDLIYNATFLDGSEVTDERCPNTDPFTDQDQPKNNDLSNSLLYLAGQSYSNFKSLAMGFQLNESSYKENYSLYDVPGARYSMISSDSTGKDATYYIYWADQEEDLVKGDKDFQQIFTVLTKMENKKFISFLPPVDVDRYFADFPRKQPRNEDFQYRSLQNIIFERYTKYVSEKLIRGKFITVNDNNKRVYFTLYYIKYARLLATHLYLMIGRSD